MEKEIRSSFFLCLVLIQTSSSIKRIDLEKCITTMNVNLTNVCKCFENKHIQVLNLLCDFADEIYEFRIASNASSVIHWQTVDDNT